MKWSYPAWCLVVALVLLGPVAARVLTWQRQEPKTVDTNVALAGEVLFSHEWQPNDPLCNGGDGIGPVFNGKSCVACHHLGGVGGGGGVDKNVTMFVVFSPDGRTPDRQGAVHAFATSAQFKETLKNVDASLPATSQPALSDIVSGPSGVTNFAVPTNIRLSQRNTPALFGLGLIDLIPEQAIIANERKQRVRHGMVSGDSTTVAVGRIHRLEDGRIGRFGWKAQMATLADFVEAACANELGLGNPTHAQPRSMSLAAYQSAALDLTQAQCDDLTGFVAALPMPKETPNAQAAHGKALFAKIGCAECHTETLGSVSGLYSDLLLHRMGRALEGANAYYGTPIPTTGGTSGGIASGPLPDEWRTPPLWGIADSGPYMHDGRANTLEEAIQLHGGQAASSAEQFSRLSGQNRMQLVAFLRSLRAP